MMINNVNLTNDTNHRNLNLLTTTTTNMDASEQFSVSQNTAPILNKYSTTSSRETLNFKNTLSAQTEKPKEQQHVRLQNNGWNYHNFCRFYKNHNNISNKNNKSMQEFNVQKKCQQISADRVIEMSKNVTQNDIERQQVLDLMKSTINNNNNNNNSHQASETAATFKRTEDQENAFRLVEDVHNYAKLNQQPFSESSSTETSRSSPNAADDEEDKLDNDDDDDDNDNAIKIPLRYLSRSKYLSEKMKEKEQRKKFINNISYKYHEDEDVHIDVETVPKEEEIIISRDKNEVQVPAAKADHSPPDHHARRPMNAFLIFCKRHRAIVKDRYKALENRAITKILGDWWASLELNDKQCFTDLAQQNKDAFFSANPNFKWYKLPAPPLRTLQTRPTPNETLTMDTLLNKQHDNSADNYFKFADETQMGDLNTLLMYDKSNKKKLAANKVNGALQQALGETKHFLNMHMHNGRRSHANKRGFTYSDTHSFSSNSSGEDYIPKKTSRSCKGKIYQELIQSGQITTAIVKRTKDAALPKSMQEEKHFTMMMMNANNIDENSGMTSAEAAATASANGIHFRGNNDNNHTEMSNYMEGNSIFDLEEKIKELPALNLDEYLQRKRNIKKKRKVNVNKKRNIKNVALKSNNINMDKDVSRDIETNNNIRMTKRQECTSPSSKMVVAVGSQKRKARKESITRRDVSIVENEVTAVLPMNNTRNYFNESSISDTTNDSLPAGINLSLNFAGNDNNNILILNNNNNNIAGIMQSDLNDFNKITTPTTTTTISPTSDLLILAEVAVNRTQCSQN